MMRFMILRKAGAANEAGTYDAKVLHALDLYRRELEQAGVLEFLEDLQPSAAGVCVRFERGEVRIIQGAFESDQDVASIGMIEAASPQEAIQWLKRWPVVDADGEATIELRETGCSGGVGRVATSPETRVASTRRYAILLKSNADMERGIVAEQSCLAAMTKRNAEGVASGTLLGGEGLQPSAQGHRVRFSGGKPIVIDGPFTEVKELVAGYWLIQAASMDEAIEWVRSYPFPMDQAVVEIRPLFEPHELQAARQA